MTLQRPIELSCPAGSGAAYEHGAHLTSWSPTGEAPVVWLSALARFESNVAIRGGVPIVFPWFGAGRPGNLAPAHGFARTSHWTIVETGLDGDDAVAIFAFERVGAGEPEFPFAFSARYEVRLGRTLQLSLTVENSDEQPFSFEEALHAYFAVGDVREVVVEGLDGRTYLDQADPAGLSVKTQCGDVTFVGETDRIYAASGQVRVVDPVLGRVLVIDKKASASTVVWNPWIDKARRMDDFGNDEWPSMLCIEGGNLRKSAVRLTPGDTHTMRYSVRVESLG